MSAQPKEARAAQVITIDGPAASGKSSVALRVAEALGIPYVSSGLLYRGVAHLGLEASVDLHDSALLLELLKGKSVAVAARVGEDNSLLIARKVVPPEALFNDLVDAHVSTVAALPGVRAWVNEKLHEIEGSFVVEGRDMGRAVFPQAAHKFYLTARPEVRALRRLGERSAELAELTEAIRVRDAKDALQLEPAPDATFIATDTLTLDGVVQAVLTRL